MFYCMHINQRSCLLSPPFASNATCPHSPPRHANPTNTVLNFLLTRFSLGCGPDDPPEAVLFGMGMVPVSCHCRWAEQ